MGQMINPDWISQTIQGNADRCLTLWKMALVQYMRDAREELATGRNPDGKEAEYPSALTDLRNGRYQLRRICNHLDLDADQVAAGLMNNL